MGRTIGAAFFLLVQAWAAQAHPGVGIVVKGDGQVFYTDLAHVWRTTAGGAPAIAVRDVHTHEIFLDDDGNLFGEHLWYEGEVVDKWGHRVWQLKADGSIVTVIPPTEGFLRDYSFVRDASGTMYWAERAAATAIMKRKPPGKPEVHARGAFRDVGWMTASREGVVYFIDDADLIRVLRDGRVETVAKNLRETSFTQVHVADRHALMGPWLDGQGNVYVAVWGARLVKKITPAGAVTIFARTSFPWSPTGGAFAPNGDLWLLESTMANQVRARRVTRGELEGRAQ